LAQERDVLIQKFLFPRHARHGPQLLQGAAVYKPPIGWVGDFEITAP
jgi:hypothetical protein